MRAWRKCNYSNEHVLSHDGRLIWWALSHKLRFARLLDCKHLRNWTFLLHVEILCKELEKVHCTPYWPWEPLQLDQEETQSAFRTPLLQCNIEQASTVVSSSPRLPYSCFKRKRFWPSGPQEREQLLAFCCILGQRTRLKQFSKQFPSKCLLFFTLWGTSTIKWTLFSRTRNKHQDRRRKCTTVSPLVSIYSKVTTSCSSLFVGPRTIHVPREKLCCFFLRDFHLLINLNLLQMQ